MDALTIILVTLSVTFNVLIIGVGGLSYSAWKKRQKESSNIEKMFQGWKEGQ